jgi:hypothetical protein
MKASGGEHLHESQSEQPGVFHFISSQARSIEKRGHNAAERK